MIDPMTIIALAFAGGTLGSSVLDYFLGSKRIGTEQMALGLQEKQMQAAAGMGRREEYRSDKLQKQLIEQQDKQFMRERGSQERMGRMQAESDESRMLMSMIMSLSGLNQQATERMSRPQPSRMSMMGMMR